MLLANKVMRRYIADIFISLTQEKRMGLTDNSFNILYYNLKGSRQTVLMSGRYF